MKKELTTYLKKLNIYHPLQSRYRSAIAGVTRIFTKIRYAGLQGSGFTCNVCGKRYRRFVPDYPSPAIAAAINKHQVIAGYGEHVFCPNCMSKNRERLLLAVLENDVDIRGSRILHFSPERNLFNYLKDIAVVTTVDMVPGFYRNIDPQISFADATHLPFEDGSFDFVIANHILEHIPDDSKAIAEIYRILKPGARAILQVPFSASNSFTISEPEINDPVRQEQLFGQKDHVRIYGLQDYITRVEAAGFKNEIIFPGSLAKYRHLAIQENEPVFLFLK